MNLGSQLARRPVFATAGPWIAAVGVVLALPLLFGSGLALTTMSLMGIMIVFALSYNMLLGQTGLLSFGHAVFFGLGGYFTVHLMNAAESRGLPVPLVVFPLAGGLAGLFFGLLFGTVSTRRAGTAFAMITLGVCELVASSALILKHFFGGEEGIHTDRTALAHLFGISFGPQIQVYYLIAGWCLASAAAMYALTRTPFGRVCNATRDNPERASFIGYNPQTVRFIAFSLAAMFAGIAGGLSAINFELMSASELGVTQSGTVILMTYIGGVGEFGGPILGAILLTYLQVTLSGITDVWQLYLGLLFVGIVMFAPEGLAGLLARQRPLLQGGQLHRLAPYYLFALLPGLAAGVGLSMVIEMTNRLTVHATDGPAMQFGPVTFAATSPLPWLVAVALLAVGTWAFVRAARMARNAYGEAIVTALAHRGVS
ncbi:MAG TPA: branched-chain amino acid ABC transporter permease [Candidatus Elarobacter sp.]|jgi:branched-chain amino acid transport system permease protein|nr:branched-chain amino acid ABC transporter permease [Candidatus Elarobacter sp.]